MRVALSEVNSLLVRSTAGSYVLVHESGELDKRIVSDRH